MGDFDVFDEWGNWVGKFTPAAGGASGCFLLMIFLIPILVFGFFIYMFIYKPIVKGYEEAKKGKWEEALITWALPGALIVLPLICAVFAYVSVTIALPVRGH